MKTPVFTGTCTALITPFLPSGAIDYETFARQIDRQLEFGVDALCVCGTTGESATLTTEEHVKLVDYCVAHVAGQCKVLAGSGSNSSEANILEDDIVMMYGTLAGDYTYETVMGNELTVPFLMAEYIDIQ